MVFINDIPPNELIKKVAEELKKFSEIKQPVWAAFCKTGMQKERPPSNEEWWHTRAAALLRTIALRGPIGVSKLRTKYGGRKNRGHKPDKFYRGAGNNIRKIMQQLEKAQLIKKAEAGVHKGRIITPKGESLLDKAAITMLKASPSPRKVAKKFAEAKEEKAEKSGKPEKITITT